MAAERETLYTQNLAKNDHPRLRITAREVSWDHAGLTLELKNSRAQNSPTITIATMPNTQSHCRLVQPRN